MCMNYDLKRKVHLQGDAVTSSENLIRILSKQFHSARYPHPRNLWHRQPGSHILYPQAPSHPFTISCSTITLYLFNILNFLEQNILSKQENHYNSPGHKDIHQALLPPQAHVSQYPRDQLEGRKCSFLTHCFRGCRLSTQEGTGLSTLIGSQCLA